MKITSPDFQNNGNIPKHFTCQGEDVNPTLVIDEIPEGTKTSKGRAIQNLINIDPEDKVKAYINVKDLKDEDYINNNFIILATKAGTIKKTSLEAYSRPRQNGIIAINIRENDELL